VTRAASPHPVLPGVRRVPIRPVAGPPAGQGLGPVTTTVTWLIERCDTSGRWHGTASGLRWSRQARPDLEARVGGLMIADLIRPEWDMGRLAERPVQRGHLFGSAIKGEGAPGRLLAAGLPPDPSAHLRAELILAPGTADAAGWIFGSDLPDPEAPMPIPIRDWLRDMALLPHLPEWQLPLPELVTDAGGRLTYADLAGVESVQEVVERRRIAADLLPLDRPAGWRAVFRILAGEP
jgi:hypothetical protein